MLLVVGFVLFLLVLAYIVVGSLRPRHVVEFDPSPLISRAHRPEGLVRDTVTIDARDGEAWRFFDFAAGSRLDPPDTAGWDLAFRRFRVIASTGVADLGAVPFYGVHEAPADSYVLTTWASDTVNPALDRWYRYDFFSHLLQSKSHVYVVRTADGRYAKLRFLSYYCTGTVAGCVTFEYVYQGSDSRALR